MLRYELFCVVSLTSVLAAMAKPVASHTMRAIRIQRRKLMLWFKLLSLTIIITGMLMYCCIHSTILLRI